MYFIKKKSNAVILAGECSKFYCQNTSSTLVFSVSYCIQIMDKNRAPIGGEKISEK